MAVTRCVCFRKSLSELKDLAAQRGWTSVDEIAAATGCTTGCGACKPYVAAMLATGATCFAVKRANEELPQACTPDPWDRGA
ncbi:MAG: (2Fe-2S)-binding protein [Planctomycetota bacterium]|jgi:NAD(P)H-nitrite reductase large subunit|nr:(2Fe-2S)-binding protein [Planctomycetota bacterium]